MNLFSDDDLQLLVDLNFPKKPVVMGFSIERPQDLPRLSEKIRFCDMVTKAQHGDTFYTDRDNHSCEAGLWVLGYEYPLPGFVSGAFGHLLGGYKTARAGARIYSHNPTFPRDSVKYVSFANPDNLSFLGDVLLIVTNELQTHTVLRATAYDNGELITSKGTLSGECAWWSAYPYTSGKTNYLIGSVGYASMRAENWKPGEVVIAIPAERVPLVMQNIREMPRPEDMPFYGPEGVKFKFELRRRLGLDPENAD